MGQTWPEHLTTDYAGAAVRLTTVMQDRQQYLLFGCVELYPHEIPLPRASIRRRSGSAKRGRWCPLSR
jgi:hypothetical protein